MVVGVSATEKTQCGWRIIAGSVVQVGQRRDSTVRKVCVILANNACPSAVGRETKLRRLQARVISDGRAAAVVSDTLWGAPRRVIHIVYIVCPASVWRSRRYRATVLTEFHCTLVFAIVSAVGGICFIITALFQASSFNFRAPPGGLLFFVSHQGLA